MNTQPNGGPADTADPRAAYALRGEPADRLRAEERGLLACVHCGFCLNACPTFRRLGYEGDSPRGRLDLMRAVAEGRLEADDPAFRLHIDQCLGCRACEPVCPSGVPYGFLLERARGTIAEAVGIPPSTRMLIAAYTHPWLAPIVTGGSRLLRATGLAHLLARLLPRKGLAAPRFALAMLASSAPWRELRRARSAPAAAATGAPAPPHPEQRLGAPVEDRGAASVRAFADPHALMGAYPRATSAPPRQPPTPPAKRPIRVGMLSGCVQQSLFARVNDATGRVLRVNGCEVVEVAGQVCCGALDAHAGRLDRAAELARRNIAAFEAAGVDVVVVNAAGCGAMMKEYAEQLHGDDAWHDRAESFVRRVRDVAEFLMERGVAAGAPVPVRVTFDAPCHLHHGQRIREAPIRLLDSVPGLERVPLAGAEECCGGAGLYGVHHPELGGRILRDKVASIRATGAAAVATPNPGCMMQIGAGLLLEGESTVVVHPIEILDESYRRAAAAADRE